MNLVDLSEGSFQTWRLTATDAASDLVECFFEEDTLLCEKC
jgi:hypothetical protein